MQTTIYFDMDGTLADLYGVEGWLDCLIASDVLPYEIAKPLLRLSALARLLNRLKAKGFKVGVISWLAKSGTAEYNEEVRAVKQDWLNKHLKSVQFDEVNIIEYGTPKNQFCKTEQDILFDDESRNRDAWTGKAYSENEILEILKELLKNA